MMQSIMKRRPKVTISEVLSALIVVYRRRGERGRMCREGEDYGEREGGRAH